MPLLSSPVFLFLYFLGLPLFLHELGHWVGLKYFRLPYKFKVMRGFLGPEIGFEWTREDIDIETLKKYLIVSLAGAFPPLLMLVPAFITKSLPFVACSSVLCLFYSIWTCIETWLNVRRIET